MPIPDYQSLMLPLLEHAARCETRVPDVAEEIADELGLTREERDEMLPSARQRLLHNRIHWAKFYMAKAGLLDQPQRGRFVASQQGRALLASNPERISVETLIPVLCQDRVQAALRGVAVCAEHRARGVGSGE